MRSVISNRVAIIHDLYRLKNKLTFTGPGQYRGMLGLDLVDLVAESIMEQTVLDQSDPRGNPLAPLSPKYLASKVKQGYSDLILVRTGEMLSLKNLRGQFMVQAVHVQMVYGGNQQVMQKAEWAHEGSKKRNRPKRKFYELNEHTNAELDRVITGRFDRTLAEAAAS
jgi:hypothetical protein